MESLKQSLFVPDVRGDIYSRENLYFSELREGEVWDMKNINRFSLMQFSFLLFRSFLYQEKTGTRLKLVNLQPEVKKHLSLSGFTSGFDSIEFDSFIPVSVQKQAFHTKFRTGSHFNLPGTSFRARRSERGKIQISGGSLGIAKPAEREIFQKMYNKMKDREGLVYFTSNEISILKLNEKNQPNNRIFTHKKNTPGRNFNFYYIEVENSISG